MVDGVVERSGGEPYGNGMDARVAVLETIAAQTSTTLAEMRKEMHDFRAEIRAKLQGFRSEVHTEMRDLRRTHDRDFRITFGATITTTLGLAALIAHVAHWL